MKKISVVLGLAMFLAFGLQAQSDCASKKTSCAKEKSAKSVSVEDQKNMEAAVKLASMDESIEKKVCEHSGKVSFYRKEATGQNGEVKLVSVEYDANENQFVNVSPLDKKEGAAKMGCCSAKSAAAAGCCASKKSNSAEASAKETKSAFEAAPEKQDKVTPVKKGS